MANIKEDIKEIKEMIKGEEKKGKPRKFKLPFSSRVTLVKAKRNYITIMRINENGQVAFRKVQITEQTFLEEGIPRLATAGYVVYFKKNPMIILPSWSVEPFSPMDYYKKTLNDGSNTKGYQILMNRMKLSTVETKKQIGGVGKWIIGIGLVLVIGYALLTGGG